MRITWVQQDNTHTVSGHKVVFRDDSLKVSKVVLTPKRGMKSGRPKTLFYIDGDPREFRSEDDLVKAYAPLLKSISRGA